jgi:hypothetical protein
MSISKTEREWRRRQTRAMVVLGRLYRVIERRAGELSTRHLGVVAVRLEVARGLGGVAHTAEQCDVFDLARSVDVVARLHALTVLLDVRAEVLTDITHEGR